MVSIACAGFATSYALSHWTNANNQVVQFVPALVVGFLGNLYTKLTQDISFDATLLGSFLLVPGAVGLRSGLAAFSGAQGGNTGAAFALVCHTFSQIPADILHQLTNCKKKFFIRSP